MPIFEVTNPQGKKYRVNAPEGATQDDAINYVASQQAQEPYKPDYTLGEVVGKGFGRGKERISSAFGDVLPAMGAAALGFDNYAKQQMKEAQQSEEYIARTMAPQYPSYKDVKGVGDAGKFVLETAFEQIPNLLTMIGTGVVGGIAGKAAVSKGAQQAVKEYSKKELKENMSAEASARAAAKIANQINKGKKIGQLGGVFLGSYSLNAPEVFQNIYDQTGEFEPAAASIAGIVNASLDSILPTAIMRSFSTPGRAGVVTRILEKSGMQPGLARRATANVLGGVGVEGLTESAQEAVSIAAEKFVQDHSLIFDSDDYDRMLEAGVKGAVAGGTFRGVSAVPEHLREKALTKKATPEKIIEDLNKKETEKSDIEIANELAGKTVIPEKPASEATDTVSVFKATDPSGNVYDAYGTLQQDGTTKVSAYMPDGSQFSMTADTELAKTGSGSIQELGGKIEKTDESYANLIKRKELQQELLGQLNEPEAITKVMEKDLNVYFGGYTTNEKNKIRNNLKKLRSELTKAQTRRKTEATDKKIIANQKKAINKVDPGSVVITEQMLRRVGLTASTIPPAVYNNYLNSAYTAEELDTQIKTADEISKNVTYDLNVRKTNELVKKGLASLRKEIKNVKQKSAGPESQTAGASNVGVGVPSSELTSGSSESLRNTVVGGADVAGAIESGTSGEPITLTEAETKRVQELQSQIPPALNSLDPRRFADTSKEITSQAQNKLENLKAAKETVKGKPGIKTSAAIDYITREYLPQMRSMPNVVMKELLQNSVDAVRPALKKKSISKGKIKFIVDQEKRTIQIIDNGEGMTPEIMSGPFLKLADSFKNVSDTDDKYEAAGGLGLAKSILLYGSKDIEVLSLSPKNTPKGMKFTLSGLKTTGNDLLKSAVDPNNSDLQPDIEVISFQGVDRPKKFEEVGSTFPSMQGTSIKITIPETYKDEQGETQEITMYQFASDEIERSPLFQDIEVTFVNEYGETTLDIGSNFDLYEYKVEVDAEFPWGTAKIYKTIDKIRDGDRYARVRILSNGLFQFNTKLGENADTPNREPYIPYDYYIDIKPSVSPQDSGYPFNLSRTDFTNRSKKDVQLLKQLLWINNKRDEIAEGADQFGGIYYVSKDKNNQLQSTEKKDLRPEKLKLPPEVKEIEVKDGGLYTKGQSTPTLTYSDVLNAADNVDVDNLKISQDQTDTDKIMIHDNVESRIRFSDFYNGFSPVDQYDKPNEFKSLTAIAQEKFGNRFNEFMFEIGDAFRILRDQVARLGEAGKLQNKKVGIGKSKREDDYKDVKKYVVGLSFDTEYRGVNVRIPFEGVFINPSNPEFTESSDRAGSALAYTMIHELAHFAERSHDAPFPQEMQRILSAFSEASRGDKPLFDGRKPKNRSFKSTETAIIDAIKKNRDIFDFINNISVRRDENETRPIGNRFKDAEYERDSDRSTDRTAPGTTTRLPESKRVSTDVRSGDEVNQRERQRESISPENKAAQESDVREITITDMGGVDRNQAAGIINRTSNYFQNLPFAQRGIGKELVSFLSTLKDKAAGLYVSFLSIPNKIELFGDQITGLDEVLIFLQDKANVIKQGREEVSIILRDAEQITNRYKQTNQGQKILEEWNTVLLELSRNNVNPETIIKEGETTRNQLKVENPKAYNLVERYERLPQDLKDLGNVLVTDLQTRYNNLLETMVEAYPAAEEKLREQFVTLDYYLPMVRRGNYWFKYKTKDGEEAKSSAESPFIRKQMQDRLREQGATEFVNFVRADTANIAGSPPAEFVENLKSSIKNNKDLDTATQTALMKDIEEQYIALFPEQSLRNQETHRKGIPGYINDILYAYGVTAPKIIASTANAKYNSKLINTANAISKFAAQSDNSIIRAIGRDTIKSVPFYINPVANIFASMPAYASYVWFIGGNISSAFVNLTQLPLIVMPFLQGEYGFDRSQKALFDAFSLYTQGGFEENREFLPDRTAAPFTINPKTKKKIYTGKNAALFEKGGKYYQLFKDAEQAAALRRGVGYEITELQKNLGKEVGSGLKLRTKFEAGVGYVFQNSERINREVTLIAAFNLARANNLSEADAIQKAIELTSKVHSHSLPEAGPRLFQDGIGKVAFVFKRFAQAQIYLVSKLFNDVFGAKPKTTEEQKAREIAAKQLVGVYGYSFLMAGVQGMPFYGGAAVLASLLFDDEDDPLDPHTYVNQAIGDLAYRGPLSQVLGIDFSMRTGFRDLVFREDMPRLEKVGAPTYMLEVIGGPGFSVLKRFSEGMGMVANGEIGRGAERMVPTSISNVLKTVRYNTDGMTNRYGVPIIKGDPSAYESFMQILGFTNIELSEAYTRANALKGPERKLQKRKSQLLLKYFLAKQVGDTEGMKDVQAEINRFNSKVPASFKITPKVRNRSMKFREERLKNSTNGVFIGKRNLRELEDRFGID